MARLSKKKKATKRKLVKHKKAAKRSYRRRNPDVCPKCKGSGRRYNPRTVDRVPPDDKKRKKKEESKKCDAIKEDGTRCNRKTKDGKEQCTDHVINAPYAKSIKARLAEMEAIDELAAKGGKHLKKIDIGTNEAVREIFATLRTLGPRTLERLCKDLNKDAKTVRGYVDLLKRKKLVKEGKTKRGAALISLIITD